MTFFDKLMRGGINTILTKDKGVASHVLCNRSVLSRTLRYFLANQALNGNCLMLILTRRTRLLRVSITSYPVIRHAVFPVSFFKAWGHTSCPIGIRKFRFCFMILILLTASASRRFIIFHRITNRYLTHLNRHRISNRSLSNAILIRTRVIMDT